ncbi:MAG: molybdopterin-guanine dinucleotide biosynthesis protein B [Chloroflexota bacterium]
MRAIGIVGYKNSGKTTLSRALAQELVKRGHSVAAVKHSSESMDFLSTDTSNLKEYADQVGFVSPEESGVFLKGERTLDEILTHLDADMIIIEGFKQELSYPKIACLSGREEDENLFNGLIICTVGPSDQMGEVGGQDVPYLNRNAIERIADLVEERAFKLPRLNCRGCGYEDCYGLAREIVVGAKTVDECVSLHPVVEVLIDGKPLAMNPFISRMVGDTVKAMLSSLRGFARGKIEIKID